MYFVFSTPTARPDPKIDMERKQKVELLKAEQTKRECERDPALRRKWELEAQQRREAQQDYAFGQMEDQELSRIYLTRGGMAAHKLFWAWRKQALSELQQLRETERSNQEHLAQITDTLLFAKANVALNPDNEGDSYISTTSGYPAHINDVLPVTTLAAFALKHQHSPERLYRSGAGGGKASSTRWRPGKRFSIPQILCKPEYYRWLEIGAGLGLVRDSGYDDRIQRGEL